LAEIRQLLWYDRAGIVTSRIPETAYWNQVFLSHGGDRAVVQKLTANGESDLFVADLTKGLFTRFTFDSSVDIDGVWSPDDQQVVFGSERQGSRDLYVKPSSGATNEELLLKSSEPKIPLDWSRDGHYLLYAVRDPKNSWDLSVLPMRNTDTKTEPPKPTTFLSTPYSEDQARFSSDGRFVAYRSNESGRSEVYVRTFPDGKGKWQISKDGGGLPHWRSDGKELFFISLNLQLMAVDVTLAQTPRFDAPHLLFTAQQTNVFDAAGDGRKFLWSDNLEQQTSSPIIVVLNALQ
jgi:Tol biopolymer transport system component